MTVESRSVVVRLSAEASAYIAEMQAAGKLGADAMANVEKSAMRSSAALDEVGRSAGRLALGGAAALTSLAAAGIRWESDWTGVTKTVDGTISQMAELESGLRGLAKTLPASHSEIAGVAEAAGQLGVAREDIVDFTKTMIDLGETTNLTADQAATDIAQISNVMGTSADDVDNLGAALVALGNDGASTEAQILDMAQRIAGAGAQIGLAESDILAIANAAASMGIEAEAGGSAVSRVFTSMAKATAQGGEKLEAFAEVAGMSANEFAQAFERDPARAFAAFTSGLDQINKSGGDVFTTLDRLKLSDVRVSQALLGMAASGDLLTDSLDLGAEAWRENTALVEEAEKRYGTTAAQVQVSWNKIRDAGIEASETLLPVVAAVADKVGHVADAFGRLPDPVQSSATNLLEIGTITAGGVWLGASVIGKVSALNSSLKTLAETSPRAAQGIRGVARVGAYAGGILLAAQAVNALVDSVSALSNTVNAADIPRDLERIIGGGTTDSLNKLTGALEGVNEAGAGTVSFVTNLGTLGMFHSSFERNTETIEAFDQQLAALIESGNAEQAAAAFQAIRDAAEANGGVSDKDVVKQFDAYKTALENAGTAAESSAAANDTYTKSTYRMRDGTEMTAEELGALKKAYRDARKEAAETATSFLDISEGADDASVSLGEWIAQMAEQAAALENFTANAIKAGKRGLRQGLIDELEQLGPVGALRMKQLANATDEEIDRANRAWKRGQDAAHAYVDAATEAAKPWKSSITVESAQAMERVRNLSVALSGLNDKTIYITTVMRTVHQEGRLEGQGGGGSGGGHSAPPPKRSYTAPSGRTYTGSSGRTVLSGGGATPPPLLPPKYGGIDPSFTLTPPSNLAPQLLAAIRGFAPALTQGAAGVRSEVRDLRRSIREAGGVWTQAIQKQADKLIGLAKAYDAQADALDKSTQALDQLYAAQESYVQQVAGLFNTSPFGQGLEFFDLATAANTNDSTSWQSILQQLADQGLDGPLFQQLAASGDMATAMQLLATGPAGIALREQAFAAMLAAQQRSGWFSAGQVYGGQITGQQQVVADNAAALRELKGQMQTTQTALEDTAKAVNDFPGKAKTAVQDGARIGSKQGVKEALQNLPGRH